MNNHEYHSRPEIGSSMLKDFRKSPALYYAKHVAKSIKQKSTPALKFGTLLHCLVLEPEELENRYIISSQGARRGKKWDADVIDAFKSDRECILESELAKAQAMLESVMEHAQARSLFEAGGIAEAPVFWDRDVDGTTLSLKAKPDLMIPTGFSIPFCLDVKSTKEITPRGFAKQSMDLEYDAQAAHYTEGTRHHLGLEPEEPCGFAFVAICNEPPYPVWIRVCTDKFMDGGAKLNDEALAGIALRTSGTLAWCETGQQDMNSIQSSLDPLWDR